jgi:hypothetical protein
VSEERGGCMVVVGQKDTGGQDWQLARAAAVSGLRQPCDL